MTMILANKKGKDMQQEIQQMLMNNLPFICAIAFPITVICGTTVKKMLMSTAVIYGLLLLMNSSLLN